MSNLIKPRIVSFLPAATEMVYALGLGDQLVGVTHECDFPSDAKAKPVVVRPSMALEKMSLREIDVAVAACIRSGGSLYRVDENLMLELKPDLILTQNLCQVCATSGNDLTSVLKLLQPAPEILWMTPHSLAEIFDNIREHDLAWIWNSSSSFNRFRGDSWMSDTCRACPRKELDFGGCRCQAFQLTGDANAIDPVCIYSSDHAMIETLRGSTPEALPIWRS